MSYDAAAVRRLGVDPQKLGWFTSDYSEYAPYTVASSGLSMPKRRGPSRFILPVFALIAYVSAWVVPFYATSGSPLVGLMPAIFFILIATLPFFDNLAQKGLNFGCSFVVVVLILTMWSLTLILAAGLGGAILVIRMFRKTSLKLIDEPTFKVEYVDRHGQRVFGSPGGVASAAEKFGQAAVDAGVKGEENTAMLLELLLKIPGTTVYHGLRFPGSADSDVDHAVACGSTVFLIDSKLYRWGEYEWKSSNNSDEIARTDGYGRSRKNHMHAAAEGYKRILGPGVTVTPLVLLHGKNVRVSGSRTSSNGVTMATAQDAMQFIGDTFYVKMKTWNDNASVEEKLVQNLK